MAESIADAAARIAALVGPRAAEIEEARRLPPDLAAAMRDAGLFKVCVPAAYGGGAVDSLSLIEAIETVATGDGSSGWCVMIGATSGLVAGWLPPAAAAELYGPADSVSGGALAPRGRATETPGGYRVTGRWPFGSGSQHCTWLMGGCVLEGGSGGFVALFPAAEVEIIDTWTVSGLRGTGSHDISVSDVDVPHDHTVRLDGPPVDEGALYRMPVFGLLASGVAAVSLGIARAAIDVFTDLAGAKTATGHRRILAERSTVQAEIAKAIAGVGAARALLFETVAEAWEAACVEGTVDARGRAALRLAATNAATASARAVTTAYTLGGGTAIYADHPLQRHFRDVDVATQHMMVAPATWELAGRVLLGGDPATAEL